LITYKTERERERYELIEDQTNGKLMGGVGRKSILFFYKFSTLRPFVRLEGTVWK
jgi:hypothetical protein